jgi:hypothetical protein
VPSRWMMIAALCLVACLAACSDEDPPFEAPEGLAGRWQQLGRFGDVVHEVTYGDDGTYAVIDHMSGATQGTGTYSADEQEITLRLGNSHETFHYFLRDDRLLVRALLQDGEVDGLIGTWRGTLIQGTGGTEDTYDDTLVVRADGTATFTEVNDSSPWVVEASWMVEDDRILLQGESDFDSDVSLDFHVIEGAAFGHHLMSRIADQ